MTTAPKEPTPISLPHSARSERAVLASMLASPATITRAEEALRPEDFYALRHQIIFRTLLEMNSLGEPADLVTVEAALLKRNALDEIGGMAYLQELFEVLPTSANLEHYANKVRDKAVRRKYLEAATEIARRVHDTEVETTDLAEGAERTLLALSQISAVKPYHMLSAVVSEAYASIEAMHECKRDLVGLSSGLKDLDEVTSGFQNADLIILAARPSVGKTALCLHFARHAARVQERAVMVFSLEMPRVQLGLRLISTEAGVDLKHLRAGRFKDAVWEDITGACSFLSGQRIVIDDDTSISLREMRAKARRVKAEHGLALVIVDYLQLMEAKGRDRRENRQNDVAMFSRGLKQLAREFDVPVIALSQLSRDLEKRTDKRPMLSDLRESGAIEQDADVVMFVHREDRYKDVEEQDKGVAEIIVAKQRNGPTGTVRSRFYAHVGAFADVEEGL